MERRFNRESKGGVSLQKRMIETRRKAEPAPDLTDFMNDMFFGAADIYKKNYDFTGGSSVVLDDEDDVGFDDSTRSNSARLTQEWLQEARRIVSSSPTRSDSPARRCLSGSPRFASPSNNNSQPGASLIPSLDPTRDNNLSRTRSARRAHNPSNGDRVHIPSNGINAQQRDSVRVSYRTCWVWLYNRQMSSLAIGQVYIICICVFCLIVY
ncbi:uncharacterized protein DS421_11g341290 [Arachis hypogaea]|nr:uncharacterized protein DS421_11g341290 [Arachis hypogaea]